MAQSTTESPFLALDGFPLIPEPAPSAEAGSSGSPFLGEFGSGAEGVERRGEAFRELLEDLYDAEFDATLRELVDEADAQVDRLGTGETPEAGRSHLVLDTWIEPLRTASEALVDRMADALRDETTETLDEGRVDELFESLEPRETGLEPKFEDFLGKVWKKAKAAVKGAVKIAKAGVSAALRALPIPNILGRLKALVRPLLRKVLNLALDRLPAALRPAASQLAKRFIGEADLSGELAEPAVPNELLAEDESFEWEESGPMPATLPVAALQESLDVELAGLMLLPEGEQGLLLAEANAAAEDESTTLADLAEARETFEQGIEELTDGEDPSPLVEQFVPAILPALKLGISVVGRGRVVSFLANYLGRLIAPYVGPQMTPALSRAIADSGLRLMSLETADEEANSRLASQAFSGLIEDTVARIGELDESELADEAVLEAALHEAVEEAAAANLPQSVLQSESDALEVDGEVATWIPFPRRRRPRYRKYSRTFDVRIAPQVARVVRTWGGAPLSSFLGDRYGISGPVRARVHLYRAMPGTRAGRILRGERGVGGMAAAAPDHLHPLTPVAAGLLLGEPGLGRELAEEWLESPDPLPVGGRTYYLEIPGARAVPAVDASGRTTPRRPSQVTLRRSSGGVRVAIYLSERTAQRVALHLRRSGGEPAAIALITGMARRRLAGTSKPWSSHRVAGRGRANIGLRRAGWSPRAAVGLVPRGIVSTPGGSGIDAAGGPGAEVPRGRRVIVRAIRMVLAHRLPAQREAFARAAAAEADGVTLTFEIPEAMIAAARAALGSRSPRRVPVSAAITTVTVGIEPGHRRA